MDERSECKRDSAQPSVDERSECKRARSASAIARSLDRSAQPLMVGDVLRQGFRLAYRRLGFVFLDLLWKLIWLALTLAGLFFVAVWFGTEFRFMQWLDTGNRAVNSAIALALLRRFWLANHVAILTAGTAVLFFSLGAWFLLEAGFRSRLFSSHRRAFSAFLVSNCLKSLVIFTAVLALAAICFGRYIATPLSEWPQLWPDSRGTALVSAVMIASLGFFLTILDTLLRSDAIDLLGTDLFRVTGLIGILLSFETMIVASCTVMLGVGLLNIAGLKSAVVMLVASVVAISLLNALHSYLLLVRYSAVSILRQNVIEI
jgi:hypothetical protein